MGPADHCVAQAIGMREREAEDRTDTSGDGPDDEGNRGEAQQAATFVYDLPMVVFKGHGWSTIFRSSQKTIIAEITGACRGKNACDWTGAENALFNHLIGAGKQCSRHCEANGFGGLEI